MSYLTFSNQLQVRHPIFSQWNASERFLGMESSVQAAVQTKIVSRVHRRTGKATYIDNEAPNSIVPFLSAMEASYASSGKITSCSQ